MNVEFREMSNTHNTVTIAENGLGYGVGSISVNSRLDDDTDPLTSAIVNQTEAIVKRDDTMQTVTRDDDGCPDGRQLIRVLAKGEFVIPKTPEYRQKVFGGGLTMAAAGNVASGNALGLSYAENFTKGQNLLDLKKINYGAHSADHAHGDKCGCGAIDEAPAIWTNALLFQDQITENLVALAGTSSDPEYLKERAAGVFDNIETFVTGQLEAPYSGKAIMESIADSGKAIAELTEGHLEIRVVINADIEDATFDQNAVREETNKIAQVFPVDIPRARKLARAFDTKAEKEDAFIGELIYSLATAATLTAGDLPVDVKYQDSSEIDFFAFED